MIKSKTRVRIFSVIVVAYMLFALMWWAILLVQKTNTIESLKTELADKYPEADKENYRQKVMITSEGIVFALSLITGIVLLNSAFRREMKMAKQQKNFLLSVTHELKSPITAIQLILETFKKRKLSDSQQEELIVNGQEEAQRLTKLVEDLLLAAKIDPKKTLKTESVEINKLGKTLVAQYEKLHKDRIFEFAPSDSKAFAQTHAESLSLMTSNLLDNAVKYSERSGKISMVVEDKTEAVSIKIVDLGKGIPENEKKNIFKQFYRIGDEDTRSSKGTGLGLFLVKELAEKLKIQVLVSAHKPKGSVLELLVPKTVKQ